MDLIYAALLLGEWVNEARETAFLEDRSVNAVFYGAWKSGMIAGCTHTDTSGTPTASVNDHLKFSPVRSREIPPSW